MMYFMGGHGPESSMRQRGAIAGNRNSPTLTHGAGSDLHEY
jgi:hypothetical protein